MRTIILMAFSKNLCIVWCMYILERCLFIALFLSLLTFGYWVRAAEKLPFQWCWTAHKLPVRWYWIAHKLLVRWYWIAHKLSVRWYWMAHKLPVRWCTNCQLDEIADSSQISHCKNWLPSIPLHPVNFLKYLISKIKIIILFEMFNIKYVHNDWSASN